MVRRVIPFSDFCERDEFFLKNNKTVFAVIVTFFCTLLLSTAFFEVNQTPPSMVQKAYNTIQKNYYGEIDEEKLYEGAVAGMVAALGDPYSYYMGAENYTELQNDLNSEFTGIGATVSVDPTDNLLTVVAPVEGSPAAQAGLKPNDKILSINDMAVSGDNYQDAVKLMRGDESSIGENIKLLIRPAGQQDSVVYNITRAKIVNHTVKHKMLPNQIGYIQITNFELKTDQEFKSAVDALGKDSLKGLVIDLRYNPGGAFSSTKEIADYLLPEGIITSFEYKDGSKTEYKSDANYYDIPLAVLINGSSASASEVLSGALHDHGRAVLIGEKTYGKGIVQSIIPFDETKEGETALYLTTSGYLTPNGNNIHHLGIAPDIEVPTPEYLKGTNPADIPQEEDIQLQRAISELSK